MLRLIFWWETWVLILKLYFAWLKIELLEFTWAFCKNNESLFFVVIYHFWTSCNWCSSSRIDFLSWFYLILWSHWRRTIRLLPTTFKFDSYAFLPHKLRLAHSFELIVEKLGIKGYLRDILKGWWLLLLPF